MITVYYNSTLAFSLDIHPNRSKGTNNSFSTGLHTHTTHSEETYAKQDYTIPHCGKGGGCQKGVAHMVHPSLKPLSAEAERKRTGGREATGRWV